MARTAMPQRPRWLALQLALLAAAAGGCAGPMAPREACASDAACTAHGGADRVCVAGRCRECGHDEHCPAGFACRADRCLPRPECTGKADCGPGQACDAGRCVSTAPERDPACERGLIVPLPGGGAPVGEALARVKQIAMCLPPGSGWVVEVEATSEDGARSARDALAREGVPGARIRLHRTSPQDGPVLARLRIAHYTGAKPPPLQPRTLELVRYPNIDSPAVLRPRQTAQVTVSLDDRPAPQVRVQARDGTASPSGAVPIQLPETPDLPDESAWKVTVQLRMPDASVDPSQAELLVRREGAGLPATFRVKPTWQPSEPLERRYLPLIAVFSREGRLVARAIRYVWVTADGAFQPPPDPGNDAAQGGPLEASGSQEDLLVTMLTAPRAPQAAPAGGGPAATPSSPSDRITVIASLASDSVPEISSVVPPDGFDAFLADAFARLSGHAARGGRVLPPTEEEREGARLRARSAVRQVGRDLWKVYTPPTVREKILSLQRAKPSGADVRFQANDPRFPIELLLVPVDGQGDCDQGAACELFGILHRVSRWDATRRTRAIQPDVTTRRGAIAVVAPTYGAGQALPAALAEKGDLAARGGAVQVLSSARLDPVSQLLGAAGGLSILHYAGHGQASPGVLSALDSYALRLEDSPLDLDTFRTFATWRQADRPAGPLLFLNACEVGQASGVYGFVRGWGPAALEQGAAGFVGGLWSLGDVGAAGFAHRFYDAALAGEGVAEAVRRARAAWLETADPTYLAYVFYGHPDLHIQAAP